MREGYAHIKPMRAERVAGSSRKPNVAQRNVSGIRFVITVGGRCFARRRCRRRRTITKQKQCPYGGTHTPYRVCVTVGIHGSILILPSANNSRRPYKRVRPATIIRPSIILRANTRGLIGYSSQKPCAILQRQYRVSKCTAPNVC